MTTFSLRDSKLAFLPEIIWLGPRAEARRNDALDGKAQKRLQSRVLRLEEPAHVPECIPVTLHNFYEERKSNATLSFSLNTMQITDTRSTHKDTDWVSFTLKVGTATPVSSSRSMGDLNNGTFDIGLSFSGIAINPDDTVVLNYLIINSGGPSSANTIQDTLKLLGGRLANSFNLPSLTSSLEFVASQFYQAYRLSVPDELVDDNPQTGFSASDLVREITSADNMAKKFLKSQLMKVIINCHGSNAGGLAIGGKRISASRYDKCSHF